MMSIVLGMATRVLFVMLKMIIIHVAHSIIQYYPVITYFKGPSILVRYIRSTLYPYEYLQEQLGRDRGSKYVKSESKLYAWYAITGLYYLYEVYVYVSRFYIADVTINFTINVNSYINALLSFSFVLICAGNYPEDNAR